MPSYLGKVYTRARVADRFGCGQRVAGSFNGRHYILKNCMYVRLAILQHANVQSKIYTFGADFYLALGETRD